MKQKIALAIIAKDEVEKVVAIIGKLGSYFDEISIAVDARIDEFHALASDKVKIYPYSWCNDFSHKRNFLAEKITCPFYLRLDTDDDIENPQIIAEIVNTMSERGIDIFYVPYMYAQDEHGNCIAKHWRETIIRKRPDVYWKKSIHENVFMEDSNKCLIVRDDRLKIIHHITHEHAEESYKRNIQYLIEEFKQGGPNTDPRTIAYIGRMLMAKGKYQEAVIFLGDLVKRSGWDDDRYFAWVQMSQCYQMMGKFDVAISCANEALGINTTFPDAYLQMGAIYLAKQDFVKAVDWIMPGVVRPEPDTVLVVDPTFYTYKACINAALALLGKGDLETAMKYYQKAKAYSPKDPYILGFEKLFTDAFEDNKYLHNLAWLIHYTKERDSKKVQNLVESMPANIFRDERACGIRNQFATPRRWPSNSVVIFCGQAWEDWSPVSTLKGIGGSEEAVIYLSKELTSLGYEVTVFNSCGDLSGVYDGVTYKPYYEFNPNDTYNFLISWRLNYLGNVKATKKYVWLHDVPSADMFTKESLDTFDKIIVLSEFHKSLLPTFIPKDKVCVSSNGINLPDFQKNGVLRNPKRLIYTSSYDRGIQHLLEAWNDVRKEVPDAELHLFYGWNTYDAMMEKGARPREFRDSMTKLMNQPGVFEHGRVGHKQLIKEFQKSGIWVYPSHFEEISCISAMKAQSCGCVPVCTDYAALAETVKAGVKIPGTCFDNAVVEKFKTELVSLLKDDERQESLRAQVVLHKQDFGWDKVASQWKKELFQ